MSLSVRLLPEAKVTFRTLLEYLAAGDSLDEFLDEVLSLRREQAETAVRIVRSQSEYRWR